MVVPVRPFDWMAAPGCEDALRDALKRLPARVPLPEVYAILRLAKFREREDKKARAIRRRSRTWLDDRRRVGRDLATLETRIKRIYGAADGYRRFALRVLAIGPAHRKLLGPGTDRVLGAVEQLRAAIENDPVLSAPLGQHRRGQPNRPWLRWAEDELRRRRITKGATLELLRLIGLKPLE